MTSLTVTGSNWNDRSHTDPRASVFSAQYAPSVFTFNANWTPAPLSAPAPLQSFGESATASSSRASPSRWSTDESYLRGRRAGPSSAPPEVFDGDGECVSHLNFDSDSDGDGDAGEDKEEARCFGRYDWHEGQPGRHGHDYDEDCSPGPTPTQEQPYYRPFVSDRRPAASPVADSNAVLRAYLESYGFPDGLGYERPPPGLSKRSSSPSSRYSFHGGASSDDRFDNNNSISKLCYYDYPRPSPPSANSPSGPDYRSELPPLAPSAWPVSVEASSALLTSLSLDSALLDDPHGAWEALCWDEAAPESDTESEAGPEYERDGQVGQDEVPELRTGPGGQVDSWLGSTGQVDDVGLPYRAHEKAGEEAPWRESSPSPVFRRDDITESDVDTEAYHDGDDGADVRTVSNATWNDTARARASGVSTNTSAGTSTITAEDSEEWISLTGARAQAARARILPYRYLQAPFPTYPETDTDVSMCAVSVDVGGTARTTADPVLARPPPVAPVMARHEAGHADVPGDAQTINAELGDVLVNTDGEGVAEDETAPDYGECGRDRLVTLSERDPPPYDLEYESTYASRSQSRLQDRAGDNEDIQTGDQSQTTSTSLSQPKIFTHESVMRTRSQLTFPQSPTESDTIQSTISPTSTYSSNATPLFSRSPISPTTTEATALMTPAGPHLSTFSNMHPFRGSCQDSHLVPSSAKIGGFNQGSDSTEGRPDSSPYPDPNAFAISSSTRGTRGPRPLPPRPAGLGPRTMAGAWLSASAAGPYATGSGVRVVPSSVAGPAPGVGSARFTSWNTLSNRSGFSTNFSSESQERVSDLRYTVPASGFEADAGRVDNRANVSEEGVGTSGSQSNGGHDIAGEERASARYPFSIAPSALPVPSKKSYSTESLVRLNMVKEKEDERERFSDESMVEFRSSSETAFQIIASRIHAGTEGIGMQPAPSLQRGKRSRSGSGNSSAGKSLHRLATRCSTLTRRIGLVASGRER